MQSFLIVMLSLAITAISGGCTTTPIPNNSLPNTTIIAPSDRKSVALESSLPTSVPPESNPLTDIANENILTMQIQIEDKTYTAVLYDNATTQSLIEQLPMTVTMNDMNRNEKYFYFSEPLPQFNESVGNIMTGDIMLYGSDCFVLFYESFSTSYSYTKLGFIEDATGLVEVLGTGSVEVTFRTEK